MGIFSTNGRHAMNEKYPDICEALRRHKVKCACIVFEDGDIIDFDCHARCHDDRS